MVPENRKEKHSNKRWKAKTKAIGKGKGTHRETRESTKIVAKDDDCSQAG